MLKNIKNQFVKVIKSQTVPEMVRNTPWGFPYFIMFVPLFMMMLIPLLQLTENIFYPDAQLLTFLTNVNIIHRFALYLYPVGLAVLIAKNTVEKRKLKDMYSSYLPLVFFGITLLFILISPFINGFTDAVVSGDKYRGESLITVALYFAFYFPVSAALNTENKKKILIYTYMITSIPIAVMMMADTWFTEIAAFRSGTGPSAIFHQFNHYGYYLLMNILTSEVLFIKEKNIKLRILCMVSFILNIIVLIINDTFGCYLACAVALVFSVIVLSVCDRKCCKAALAMTGIFVVISIVMGFWYDSVLHNLLTFGKDVNDIATAPESSDGAGTGRWTLWMHTVSYIKERPLFGFGIEGTNERLFEETNGCNTRPHCEFLQYAVFYGIPAAAAYIAGAFSVFINGLKKRYSLDIYTMAAIVASFGYLVSSMFGNTMYYTAPHFFILLGIAFNTGKSDASE